jgi:ZIP family zinc transporter
MGLGALITTLFGTRTDKMTSIFLSFAGGVMLSIVFFELIPEAIELSSVLVTIAGLIAGAVMVLVLHSIMDKLTSMKGSQKVHDSFAEFFHSNDVITKKSGMIRSGMIMLFAIALHNVPEGLAMGVAGHYDRNLAVSLAIIIGLHNIPEGMAVAAPLIVGGLSKTKSVIITLIAGATTIIGTIAGVLIGAISDAAISFSLSAAGGAMLYVVIGEILPQSVVSSNDRVPTLFALAGMIVGMLFIVTLG